MGFATANASGEAEHLNFADEIAYNNHDIDDGLKSGLITFDDLKSITVWQTHFDEMEKKYPEANDKQLKRLTVKAIINLFVSDLISYTNSRIEELKIKTIQDVREKGKDLVGFSPEIKILNTELKRFLFNKLYRHYRVERMAEKAKRVITELFTAYKSNKKIVPPGFSEAYSDDTSFERVVCDYIAGMTDRYALGEYKKLFDPMAKV